MRAGPSVFLDQAGQEKKVPLSVRDPSPSIARHWAKSPSDLAYVGARCRICREEARMVEKNRALRCGSTTRRTSMRCSASPAACSGGSGGHKGGRDDVVLVATACHRASDQRPNRVENLTSSLGGAFPRAGSAGATSSTWRSAGRSRTEPFEMELPKGCVDFLDLASDLPFSADAGPLTLALSGLRG
ncbi:MAG: hypothetical protein Udaeo2_12690 [Candidatus Udaeobacter sp.]|nr:MAG: hypothetical protein Udaeo2_12690 [Candidatus Udaeobacter sp.]